MSLARAQSAFRRYGLPGLAKAGLSRIGGRWAAWNTVLLFERPTGPFLPRAAVIRRIEREPGDLLSWATDLEPGVVAERLARGDVCYAGYTNEGVPAGYCWATTEDPWVAEVEDTLPLPPGTVWIYDCRVLPAFRGRGAYALGLEAVCRDLAERGIARRALLGSLWENRASRRGIEKAGFRRCGALNMISIAGWRRRWKREA